MIALKSASSSANDVSMRQAISGCVGPDLPADLDAVAVGQADVEDGDVGARRGDPAVGLLGGAGLADDLDVVLGLEELAEAPADDLVVVEQEHADRHCSPVCPFAEPRLRGARRVRS